MNYLHSIADFWALCAHKTTNFMNNEYHTHRILFSHDRVLYSSSFLILPCLVVYIFFYFLTKKWLPFVKKTQSGLILFDLLFIVHTPPLILLLGISHCSMPIFGTPPSLHPVRKKRTTIRSLAASKDVQKTAPKLKSTHSSTATSTMYPRDQPQIW